MAGTQPTHSTPAQDTKHRKLRRFWKPRKQGVTTPAPHPSTPPWWVNLLTDAGRPVVAVVVMAMCAPGEHHLGRLAGWSDRLAWGMAFVLAAYAGIAAAVASKRPRGAPGKRSAVVGAWLALAAGMSAQPVSHMFVTGHWSADPRPPVWLVISVSCVPPLVLGHLLHLAATPATVRAEQHAATLVTPADTSVTASAEPILKHQAATIPPVPEQAPALPVTPPSAPAATFRAPEMTAADTSVTPPDAVQDQDDEERQEQPEQPPRPVYDDPRHEAIRALYETGHRPGTTAMRDAIENATGTRPSASGARTMRQVIEAVESHLATLPPAPVQLPRHTA